MWYNPDPKPKKSKMTIGSHFCARDTTGHAVVQAIMGATIAVQSSKVAKFSCCDRSQLRVGKRVVSDQNCNQGQIEKNIDRTIDTTKKTVRVSTCAIRNNMPKTKGKHLVFKSSINGMKTYLLVDNGSETKLIDEFFVHMNKISTFKLKKVIKLPFGNGEVV